MKMTARKAVDPIIATLLLIAIAVAAGIIVYVYVNSLAGGLTQAGGQQVSDQIAMDAYNYGTISSGVTLTVRDVGSSTVTINSVFFDGILVPGASLTAQSPATCATGGVAISPTGACTFTLTPATAPTSGTSHIVKILTSSGGTSVMTVVAGRTG
jgi:flagellin-like protein